MSQYGYTGFSGINSGARDLTLDAINWGNIGPGNSPQSNTDQVIAGLGSGQTVTLRATLSSGTYGAGAKGFIVVLNSVDAGSITPADAATLDVNVINVDTVHYRATKGAPGSGTSWEATVTITNLQTGQTVDTFTVSVDAGP